MEKNTFDLENFPTSESAIRMMEYVTGGFYDRSYVGKWIYQIIGIEWDSARIIFEDLPYQFFPETATWGLRYHEIKWQLPVREDLPYEERRRRIYRKRDYRAPMIPYNMERYLENVTDSEVHVADVNDPGECGFVTSHPNVFKVFFIIGEETRNLKLIYEMLKRLKQSHTTCEVEFDYKANIEIRSSVVVGIGNSIKVKARVITKIIVEPMDNIASVLFINQSILVKASDEITEKDVYTLSETGKKARVLTENGSVVRIE